MGLDWPELRSRCSRCGMEDHTLDGCHAWCDHAPDAPCVVRLAFSIRVTFPPASVGPTATDTGLIALARIAAGWTDTRGGTYITTSRNTDDGSAVVTLAHLRSI